MAANTSTYATGYKASVTIGSTTYAQAKYFTLPDPTAGVVSITHLGGFQKQPDGRSDFGKIIVSIPQDGTTLHMESNTDASPKYHTVSVAPAQGGLSGKTYTATSAYCVRDSGGDLRRGQSVDRVLEFELLTEGSWA